MNTERPLSRRDVLKGLAVMAVGAATGTLMPASDAEPRRETPQPKPPEPPTPTRGATQTEVPSRIPVVPPATRAAEVVTQAPIVVVEAPPVVTERPAPVVTAAPTPRPTPVETPKPKETVTFQGSRLTRELLDGIFSRSGTGGGDRTPTPDTGGVKTKPVLTDVDYMASVWSFHPTTVSEIIQTPIGTLKLAASGAAQIGLEGSTYPFRRSEVRFFGFKAQFLQSITEIRPSEAKPEGVIVKRGANVSVLGTFKDREGKSWTAVSIADFTREARPDPHLFFTILPTFQEADSSKWSLERLVTREGFGFDKASTTISFEGDGKSYQWQINTLDDELEDEVLKEAGVFWIEKTTNPIVPYPTSTITEKLQGKAYQFSLNPEGVPVILSEGKETTHAEYNAANNEWAWKEIPEQPRTVAWPIERIVEAQEVPPGVVPPLVAFWVEYGGKAEMAVTGTGKDMVVINDLPLGAKIRLPLGGKLLYLRSDIAESIDVTVRPDLRVAMTFSPTFLDGSVKKAGVTLSTGALVGEIRNDSVIRHPKLENGQIWMFADNPQTKAGYRIDLNKSLLRDEQGNIVTFENP